MISTVKKRLPTFREVLSVYGVIIFILFSWATIIFFWRLSAWLYYLNLGEIGVLYAYAASTEFVESLIYLTILLLLCMALPGAVLKEHFSVRGTIIAIAMPGFVLLADYLIAIRDFTPVISIPMAFAVSAGLALMWIWLASRYKALGQAADFIMERVSIFTYVYTMIAVISLVVVLIRNVG